MNFFHNKRVSKVNTAETEGLFESLAIAMIMFTTHKIIFND